MKKTYLMLLLGLVGFVSGCTNEDGSEGSTPSGNPGEIRLVFSGSGESEEYTKAIASDSENKIGTFSVLRRPMLPIPIMSMWKPGQ